MEQLARDFGDAWRRFLALKTVRLQQETLEWEWERGRTDYVAFLIAVADPEVRKHVAGEVAQVEDIPGVEPYPEGYWHVTVKGVGFLQDEATRPDEVTRADVEKIAEIARPLIEAMPAFDLRLGPASAFAEVVILEAHDGGVVRGMNQCLLAEVPALQRYPVDGDVFLPHVSIARFASDEGLPALKKRLAGMRERATTVSFRAEEVMLIQAHLAAGQAPMFELLASYELKH
jgi:hypothetical protein